ncbi:MAG: type secretion system protein [Acidimicrobiales bacterium]|nr:type secretion system protein [Acidimicrobiales bacterium]
MDPGLLMAATTVAAGLALVTGGMVARAHGRDDELARILGLPYGEGDVDVARIAAEHGTVVAGTLGLANRAVDRFDTTDALLSRIERADLSLRPAEVVVITAASGLAAGMAVAALTGLLWSVPVILALTPLAAKLVLDRMADRRATHFAAQLPDALAMVASSLSAGHTFLRAISMMADEYERPLADEFRRVVSETQLGSPLVDSLARMAERLQIRDVDWMVQAIRIQQTVGGQLAELLATLADFMRARDEVRREVAVLTAEGRISAYVLGAMPVLLFVAVQVINPGYMDPMLRGWGLVWLGLTVGSMTVGMAIILRMVRSVEV